MGNPTTLRYGTRLNTPTTTPSVIAYGTPKNFHPTAISTPMIELTTMRPRTNPLTARSISTASSITRSR